MTYRSQVPIPSNPIGVRQGTPDVSSGLRRTAQVVGSIAEDMAQARAVSEGLEARNAAFQASEELQEQFRTDADYSTLGKRSQEAIQERQREIMARFSSPFSSQRNSEAVASVFRQAQASIQRDGLVREGDAVQATLNSTLETLQDQVAGGRMSLADAMDMGAKDIRSAEAAGWISHTRAQALGVAHGKTLMEGLAYRKIEENPAQALKAFETEGPFSQLGDRRLAELRTRARTAISRQEAAQRDVQRLAAANLRRSIGDLEAISKAGGVIDDDLIRQSFLMAQSAGPEGVEEMRRLEDVIVRNQVIAKARTMSPRDLANEMSAARSRMNSDPDMARLYSTLEDVRDSMVSGLDTNPNAWAASAAGRELPPLEPDASPEDFRQRAVQAQVTEDAYGARGFFQPFERSQIKGWLETASPDDMLDFAARLSVGAGSRTRTALGELMSSGAEGFSILADLSLSDGGYETARAGFAGMALLRENKDLSPRGSSPGGETVDSVFASVVGTALPYHLGPVRSGYRQAAEALYAEKANRQGISEFAPDLYEEAVNEATGRTARGGGIGERNGSQFILSPDVNQALLDETMMVLAKGADVSALSVSGGTPMHEGRNGPVAMTAKEWKSARLVTVAPGLYWVSRTDPANGGDYLLDSETGENFVLDLSSGGDLRSFLEDVRADQPLPATRRRYLRRRAQRLGE